MINRNADEYVRENDQSLTLNITLNNENKFVLRNSETKKIIINLRTLLPHSPPPNARDNLPGRKECGLILHATRQERADKSDW